MLKRIWMLELLMALTVLAGCAAIEERPMTSRLVVTYATMKVIDGAEMPIEKADRVAAVADVALGLLSDDKPVLIAAIEEAVRAAIPWGDLDNADVILANALITAVAEELQSRVDDRGMLGGESLLTAREVLSWVKDAAVAAAGGRA